jgi:hypothetical protein
MRLARISHAGQPGETGGEQHQVWAVVVAGAVGSIGDRHHERDDDRASGPYVLPGGRVRAAAGDGRWFGMCLEDSLAVPRPRSRPVAASPGQRPVPARSWAGRWLPASRSPSSDRTQRSGPAAVSDGPGGRHAVVAAAARRVARARSRITAAVAASRAAPMAIRAICQPAMPPLLTWTVAAGTGATGAVPM